MKKVENSNVVEELSEIQNWFSSLCPKFAYRQREDVKGYRAALPSQPSKPEILIRKFHYQSIVISPSNLYV